MSSRLTRAVLLSGLLLGILSKQDKSVYVNITAMASGDWVGRKYTHIVGGENFYQAPEFPRISPRDSNHTVLFKVKGSYEGPPEPFHTSPSVKWDPDHVRMPFDERSTYTVYEEDRGEVILPRWLVIERALNGPIRNIDELIKAILSYNEKYRERWHFRALKECIASWSEGERKYFFEHTLKAMAEKALKLRELFQSPIPLLKQTQNKSISLTQEQISSILANAFFCTFPKRNSSDKRDEYSSYPKINFSRLFESHDVTDDVLGKLKCLINYFYRVTVKGTPKGVVTFVRRYVPNNLLPDWKNSHLPMKDLLLHVDCKTSIQDAWGLIQVDFANKYLGGGVLGHGAVQEEIMFATSPDLMASMLFTEKLNDNEAVLIIGSEKYSEYSGYSRSFKFERDYVDQTPFDSSGRRHRAVLAIDAKPYSNRGQEDNEANIARELNKAYIGFSFFSHQGTMNFPGVATGNWGCGAFGGSKSIKSLIQMMASVQANRPLAYFTFHDRELMENIMNVYQTLSEYQVTVRQLYFYIVNNLTKAPDHKRDLRSFSRGVSGSYHPRRSQRQIALSDGEAKKEDQSTAAKSIARQKRSVGDDSNDSSGPDKVETSDAIIAELLNDSPDLFSPEEYQTTDMQTNKFESEHDQSIEPKDDNKMADGDKMAGSKRTSKHTSRLFDEMQKLDDVNGKLNLPVSSSKTEKKAVLDDSPMDDDKTSESPEVKKKISGTKITDYFYKK